MLKNYWVEFGPTFQVSPMSYWVHRCIDSDSWSDASGHDPPLPKPVPGRGYARYHVEFEGFTFRFSSLDELNVCIETISRKILPRSIDLSAGFPCGPNSHWLSRLPRNVLKWKYREKAAKFLTEAKEAFTSAG